MLVYYFRYDFLQKFDFDFDYNIFGVLLIIIIFVSEQTKHIGVDVKFSFDVKDNNAKHYLIRQKGLRKFWRNF